MGSFPVLNLRYDRDNFSAGVIEMLPRLVAQRDTEAWAAELRARTGEGEYFFSVNRYLFRARRPA